MDQSCEYEWNAGRTEWSEVKWVMCLDFAVTDWFDLIPRARGCKHGDAGNEASDVECKAQVPYHKQEEETEQVGERAQWPEVLSLLCIISGYWHLHHQWHKTVVIRRHPDVSLEFPRITAQFSHHSPGLVSRQVFEACFHQLPQYLHRVTTHPSPPSSLSRGCSPIMQSTFVQVA